ncbi:hypothetical protein PSTG_13066 [Puccinia striiformis f. sp. tritici PST-78]|uniref:Uncharacterized protein n=2 Tax=Puccinia striiformis f. sp. tritici TaxID=168172 RepID=A0A0L0V2L8_9BASI|nr:hypothetical protein PSTG_13066 [Puccinia striiformis f. sp. tritici PST-78]
MPEIQVRLSVHDLPASGKLCICRPALILRHRIPFPLVIGPPGLIALLSSEPLNSAGDYASKASNFTDGFICTLGIANPPSSARFSSWNRRKSSNRNLEHPHLKMINRLITRAGRTASFLQILLYLPLALDIAGKECFLALSASLALYYSALSTLYLIFRNTRFAFVSKVFGLLQNLVIPTFLLIWLNIYSTDESKIGNPILGNNLVGPILSFWEVFLTWSTPVFVLLEGISTLLCIQSVGQISRYIVEAKNESYSFVFLVLSAAVYVGSAYFLFDSYAYAARESLSATLIGVSTTSVVFLSGIAISNRKGNVVETSLMMAYLSYNIYWLSSEKLDPVSFFSSFKSEAVPPLPPMILRSATAIIGFVSTTFGAGLDFLLACSSALPLPVFINLLYRVVALYGASRIVVAIKRANSGFAYARRLSDEEPMVRIMTVIVSYSRFVLISVYTHLLLLNNEGHQVFWRWINVFVTLGLWGVELMIGKEEGDNDSIVTGLGLKLD